MSLYGPDTDWDTDQNFTDQHTRRYLIPASKLSGTAQIIKVLLARRNNDYSLASIYIGHRAAAGDLWDFDGNQVILLFSGYATPRVEAGGLWSDPATFSFDGSKDIILSTLMLANANIPRNTPDTDYKLWYKTGNWADITDVPGMTQHPTSGDKYLVQEISIIPPTAYQLSGTAKEKGSPVIRTLRAYIRSTGLFYSTAVSNPDGTFTIEAPDDTTEMFVVAFDDDAGEDYNALIYDRVKGVEI